MFCFQLFKKPAQFGLLLLHVSFAPAAVSAESWQYHQDLDRLSNEAYSSVTSPTLPRGLYDDLKVTIMCRQQSLQVIIDSDSFIASQDSQFEMEEQLDKQAPFTLIMRTFPYSKRKGVNTTEAKALLDGMLVSQDKLYIRVKTMLKDVLAATFPLNNAHQALEKIMSDCPTPSSSGTTEATFSVHDFEHALKQLSPDQQQHVLNAIKTLLTTMKQAQ